MRNLLLFSGFIFLASCGNRSHDIQEINVKDQYLSTLETLNHALLDLQNPDTSDQHYGALDCPLCKLYHTRAAEAVYPFAYQYTQDDNVAYREAAISLGNWLIRQQYPDGSWQETPEDWTGTSTDQLLMMLKAFPILKAHLSEKENREWLSSMVKAGDYLTEVMSPEFASINYVATTCATLMTLYQLIPEEKYSEKARFLAERVIAKMDDDHFITGEGGRVFNVKYGVDLGYNMEMSLWGMAVYARLNNDSLVMDKVRQSLKRHIHFIYPDGSLDASWGIRSNKWTCFGGATSDGCQVLFSLFSDEDPVYSNASIRNLEYLRTCMKDGIVGYGPHHWRVMEDPPCIYPTFTKAKNLAMAHSYTNSDHAPYGKLPSESCGMEIFPTLNVATVSTPKMNATITAYGYKDPKGPGSKYMHRPTGGVISNLSIRNYGYLTASSQTEYHRWEPMSFPEADSIEILTPRIEFTNENGYFTNLYEFDATTDFHEENGVYHISAFGELKNREQKEGGIGYGFKYTFSDDRLRKHVSLRFHDAFENMRIIEPIILHETTEITQISDHLIQISDGFTRIFMELETKGAKLEIGNMKNYWAVYPALQAVPVIITAEFSPASIQDSLQFIYKIMTD